MFVFLMFWYFIVAAMFFITCNIVGLRHKMHKMMSVVIKTFRTWKDDELVLEINEMHVEMSHGVTMREIDE